jgi:hypothetical protein
MLEINEITMTDDAKQFCEHHLASWAMLEKLLVHKPVLQSTNVLEQMIRYELITRRRKIVLRRLVGRRAKLMRQEEDRQITEYLKFHRKREAMLYEGDCDREILGGTSMEGRG